MKSFYAPVAAAYLTLLVFSAECTPANVFPRASLPMPSSFPTSDELTPISSSQLKDPIVQDALAIVKQLVPQNVLNIPPSTFISGNQVSYNGDASANCFWPSTGCSRSQGSSYYVADVTKCPTGQWGITYDDGPTVNYVNGVHSSDTAAIRNALGDLGVKGTFFSVGANAVLHPDELKDLDKAGHQIGIHTWTHHPLTSMTNEQIVAELKYTEAMIYKATGKIPTYFRPPYGDVDDRVRAIANALGFRVVIWSKDSRDADVEAVDSNTQTIVDTILGWVSSGDKTGFVSLEHDISTFTSNVAVKALQQFKKTGTGSLKLTPVGTCMGHQFYYTGSGSRNLIGAQQKVTTTTENAAVSKSSTSSTVVTSSTTTTTTTTTTTIGNTVITNGGLSNETVTTTRSSTSSGTTRTSLSSATGLSTAVNSGSILQMRMDASLYVYGIALVAALAGYAVGL